MKKNIARRKTLKITAIYFFIGCVWIYVSDIIVQFYFSELSQVLFYSILKGVSYVFVTAALIFCLTYPALKEVLDSKESIKKVNSDLEKTNELYLELYQDYRKKQALLKSLIDSIPDLIFYKDVNSVYMGCNAAFEQFVGRLELDIVGHTDKDLFSQEQADRFMNIDKEILEGNTIVRFEERFSNPDGKEVIFETLKTPYYDNDGKIIGLIGISRDITERKIREERIQYISHHDTLTGLYNRTYFDEAKIALDRPDQLPLSVIVGDINGMKMINDTFGHKKGDTLLKEVANILKQCVQKNHVVARTGGDEFMILMPHTDGQAVKEIANRIRATAKEKRLEETLDFYMDIALGYATKNEPSESLDKAILLAEDYMYRRKLLEERSLHNDYLTYIKMTMFEKSNETEKHAERLVELSLKLGAALGLSEDELDELELVAMLHDIGKISVDKDILTKKNSLSDADWREIRKHPEVGYRIAKATSGLSHIAEYILCHHEHWDGSGYPLGLSGTAIPLISRIISIVDAYDAMTQNRAYRDAVSEEKAVKEILKNKGKQFDPEIAEIFVKEVCPQVLTG